MLRIVESFYVKSAVEPSDYPASAYPEFAFAGRSNVGKSSLINLLTNHHGLAKTSGTPGKTRLLNFFLTRYKLNDQAETSFMQFTDLPGYGFAEVSQKEQERWRIMVNKYFEQRSQLKAIFVLVDIRHDADKKDIQMLDMLRLREIAHCVIATKADKIPKTKQKKVLEALAKGLGLTTEPLIAVSALKNTGFEGIAGYLESKLQDTNAGTL
ncbi:MAG: ribosome biogenesis GTP-binding protein YihA/YsxC [Candidatus Cloacimonetes bacterium]|nr:ribosome biogenesis GTP-binding protein YihA/YsxC [Candidatus Cloacimonadota bacterium]MDY0336421.1 ribosome biogenesis GTP-binding protein YihA/YsxC [Candidatus Cloacimonadaceae bacterium]MCB5269277.1 ribosome biogenesis GTP-binding protein YihA/YsxC [Candidatus Cloacimonadota bacterium]MCK9334536.1 ribosome biogenesis GTP-binding protein YihA/YsxC [Candidatus Cloacimonadota bacterium]MDD2543814.1 ribosome biogenesis GTP-binding protein YihA/YsxC [Candidatus Cloacimonadota bacterium]